MGREVFMIDGVRIKKLKVIPHENEIPYDLGRKEG
jgi:hypothetical protein